MKKALLAAAVVVVLVLVAVGAWLVLGGGDDEKTETGSCGDSTYELTVEDDNGGVEVSFELQTPRPDETWTVVVSQGETPLLDGERRTDEDAELDVDVTAQKDAGDQFTVTATPPDGEPCTATITR